MVIGEEWVWWGGSENPAEVKETRCYYLVTILTITMYQRTRSLNFNNLTLGKDNFNSWQLVTITTGEQQLNNLDFLRSVRGFLSLVLFISGLLCCLDLLKVEQQGLSPSARGSILFLLF